MLALALYSEVEARLTIGCDTWDAVVIGAGPAGAVTARELARLGRMVLLVDKAAFPREKVCGCCVNAAAHQTLEEIGLGDLPGELDAVLTQQFQLCTPKGRLCIGVPAGFSVSRRRFDAALVHHAIRAGVTFMPATQATLHAEQANAPWRYVRLKGDHIDQPMAARLVLAADGLAGRLVQSEPGLAPIVARRSRFGVSATLDGQSCSFEPGRIYMACAEGGYVGLVRLEDEYLNVAAALDLTFVKRNGGVSAAVARILDRVGLASIHLKSACFSGTGLLTRRRRVLGSHRLLVLGDAAGYVEPFTGEGIGWALASARAMGPIGAKALDRWQPDIVSQWTRHHRHLIGRRQKSCRWLCRLVRHPNLLGMLMNVGCRAPGLARRMADAIHRPLGRGGQPRPAIAEHHEWLSRY